MMKSFTALTLALLVGFAGLDAQAAKTPKKSKFTSQNYPAKTYSSAVRSGYSTWIPQNRAYVDTAYLLVDGIGVGFERSIGKSFTVGPFISFFKLNSAKEDKDIVDVESQVQQYGLKGRYFFSGNSTQKGAYAMAALMQVSAESKASILDTDSGKAKADKMGYQVGGGFQFDLKESAPTSSKLVINLAGIYGTGFKTKNSASLASLDKTVVDKPEIIESIYLELSLGLLF